MVLLHQTLEAVDDVSRPDRTRDEVRDPEVREDRCKMRPSAWVIARMRGTSWIMWRRRSVRCCGSSDWTVYVMFKLWMLT